MTLYDNLWQSKETDLRCDVFWIWCRAFRNAKLECKQFYLSFMFYWSSSWKPFPEAVAHRCSVKKMFLENSQNSQENTSARASFLIKLHATRLCHRCFSVNFVKFRGTPFATEHLWWLLLHFEIISNLNDQILDSHPSKKPPKPYQNYSIS